jgi:hypothetical protein
MPLDRPRCRSRNPWFDVSGKISRPPSGISGGKNFLRARRETRSEEGGGLDDLEEGGSEALVY